MNLKEWIAKKGFYQSGVAKKIGISKLYLNLIVNGHRFPSQKIAQNIVEFTGGEVDFNDIFLK